MKRNFSILGPLFLIAALVFAFAPIWIGILDDQPAEKEARVDEPIIEQPVVEVTQLPMPTVVVSPTCANYDLAYAKSENRHMVYVRSVLPSWASNFELPHGEFDARDFAWSPDGRYLAFSVGYAWTESYIMIWDYTSHNVVDVFIWEGNVSRPVWSADGLSLAAISDNPYDEGDEKIVIAHLGQFLDFEYEDVALPGSVTYEDFLTWTGEEPVVVKTDPRLQEIAGYRTQFSSDNNLFWVFEGEELSSQTLLLELENVVDFAWRPVGLQCE